MNPRIKQLDDVFTAALNDLSLSITAVAQVVHRGVPEVKHVAVVSLKDKSRITYSILFHDRQRASVTLQRMEECEVLPEGEREVIREAELVH